MWRDFKAFVAKGNVLGLAVAVVMGAAFGAVVLSFTDDILMQFIAALGAKPDFKDVAVWINGTPIRVGSFVTALLSFLIVAFAMFLVVKGAERLQRKEEAKEAAPKITELELLKEIRDELRMRRPLVP